MRRNQSSLAGLLIVAVAIFLIWQAFRDRKAAAPSYDDNESRPYTNAEGYLFCFWNVENLFDDQEDASLEGGDRQLDRWFANNAQVREQKLGRLCEALLKLNDGNGPDVLALVEVEGYRAADLLRLALNQRLPESAQPYQHVVVKDTQGLRHITPAIISRLPVDATRARVLGRRQRILETPVTINGVPLIVVTSHWTSRKSDSDGDARARYADQVYGAYRAMWQRNPQVDYLACGDFNDTPQDQSVTRHLRATGDASAVMNSPTEPRLLNLLANRDPEAFGTLYFERPLIFDQIAVSPGMLDGDGWSCDPSSVAVINSLTRPNDRRRRPWGFGGESQRNPRGYSDHFPVTVRLKFTPPKS